MLKLQTKLISNCFQKEFDLIISKLSEDKNLDSSYRSFLLTGPDKITSSLLAKLKKFFSNDSFFYPIYIDGRKISNYSDFFRPIIKKAYSKTPPKICALLNAGINEKNINDLYMNFLWCSEIKKKPLLIIRRIDQLLKTLDFPDTNQADQDSKYKFSKMHLYDIIEAFPHKLIHEGVFGKCLRNYFLIEPKGAIIGSGDDDYLDFVITLGNPTYMVNTNLFLELYFQK